MSSDHKPLPSNTHTNILRLLAALASTFSAGGSTGGAFATTVTCSASPPRAGDELSASRASALVITDECRLDDTLARLPVVLVGRSGSSPVPARRGMLSAATAVPAAVRCALSPSGLTGSIAAEAKLFHASLPSSSSSRFTVRGAWDVAFGITTASTMATLGRRIFVFKLGSA